MHLTLVASLTSPYGRRLRLYLDDIPHEFEVVDFASKNEDDARLSELSPIKRVPVLLVNGAPLWESRVIFQFLQRSFARKPLSLEEENLQSALDALQDSLILPFLMRRLGHPIVSDNPYWLRVKEREAMLFAYLAKAARAHQLESWDYPAMSLWCLLDWADFRGIATEQCRAPEFQRFFALHQHHARLKTTDPRRK